MALPVRFTVSAVRSIEEALEWWARNRDKAPHALAEDLEQALALISSYPQIGTRARNASVSGVRRLHLARVRYHLYVDKITAAVAKRRLTHAQVAKLAHTSRTRITAILNRNTDGVSTDLLLRILGRLGFRARIIVSRAA